MATDKNFQKEFPWHSALLGSNKEQISNKNATSFDSKKVDSNKLTAIHWVVLQMMANPPKTIGKHLLSNIAQAIKSGVDPNAQCSLGFTALSMASLAVIHNFSDIACLESAAKTIHPQKCDPQYETLREISRILVENGATLKVNDHKFSPLLYTQLYYHERPLAQKNLLNLCEISVVELYKLALLKAATPEKNFTPIYAAMVKHGMSFIYEPFSKLSLFSTLSVLLDVYIHFGFDEFEHAYNLPSYHCKNPVTTYDLEIVSTIGYFIKNSYKGEWLKMANSDKHYHRIIFSRTEKVFVILTTYIAIMGKQMSKDDYQFDLVQSLSERLRTTTVLHKIVSSRAKWESVKGEGKGTEFIARYLPEINIELWHSVVLLMNNQVNNRCYGSGLTALHYAAEYQDFEMIQFLIDDLGAYPYAVCYDGRYFYDLTFHSGEASKRTDKEEKALTFEELIKNQVRSLMTQSAQVIIRNKIDYKCLEKDRQLFNFITLHCPRSSS